MADLEDALKFIYQENEFYRQLQQQNVSQAARDMGRELAQQRAQMQAMRHAHQEALSQLQKNAAPYLQNPISDDFPIKFNGSLKGFAEFHRDMERERDKEKRNLRVYWEHLEWPISLIGVIIVGLLLLKLLSLL